MERSEIGQYGIIWHFERPLECGQFISGDWWVVGALNVVNVTPASGPVASGEKSRTVKSIYSAVSMIDDSRMRNGSMIVLKPGPDQGYDSRIVNYSPDLTIKFPCAIQPNQALISTISHEKFPVEVLHHSMMWKGEASAALALKSAAVLTCVAEKPPPDAFRPAYAGASGKLYRASSIHWDRLTHLGVAGIEETVPDWEKIERYFERPWLDHIDSWLLQVTGPSENQVNYGREFSRLNSLASLMLLLDVPRERKEKLLYRFIQWGLDLAGLARCGRRWSADGGHWNGRKWPILFAGLMLQDKGLQTLVSSNDTLFSEDQQTYHGQSWSGQRALYQMVWHTYARPPYEEKRPELWDDGDRRSDSYRGVCSCGWPGTALAALLMQAKPLWNHDAFLDYCDRWMEHDNDAERKALPLSGAGVRVDPFVGAMWNSYRKRVPTQPGGDRRRKWVWSDLEKAVGGFVPNEAAE